MSDHSEPSVPLRPPTPQALLHRLPDKPGGELGPGHKPHKFIVLVIGSTAVAGKVQIARSVAKSLSCPLLQGESFHDSSAKAANVGSSRIQVAALANPPKPNSARYQRLWLSKLTRTGLLFPEESRPANEGFSGFGGMSSTSTSRRGSTSSVSVDSGSSILSASSSQRDSDSSRSNNPPPPPAKPFFVEPAVQNAVFTISEVERRRRENPALMVLTHPDLEPWHRLALRQAVGDYGIGIIFAALEDYEEESDDDLPILRPLDPRTMSSFPASCGRLDSSRRIEPSLDKEMNITIDLDADIDSKTEKIIQGARDIMGVGTQS